MNTEENRAPGRPGLTFEQYEAAFHELSSPEGVPPSQRQIRRYLGTGSNTTLSAYRRRIAEQRVEETGIPEPDSIDTKLLSTVMQLASQLSAEASQIADDRVEEIQLEAKRRIDIAETTMEKRLRDTDLLEHRAKTAEVDLKESRSESARLNQTLFTKTEELQSLSVVHAADKQALDSCHTQLNEKTQALLVTRSELEALRKTHQQQAQELSQSESALETLKESYSALQGDFALLKEGMVEISDQHALSQAEVAKNQEWITQLQLQLDSAETAQKKAQELEKTLTESLKNERQNSATLLVSYRELQAEYRSEQTHHEFMLKRLSSELLSKDKLLESLQQTLMALRPASPSEEK